MKAVFNCIIVKVLEEKKKVDPTGLLFPNQLESDGFEEATVVSVSNEHSDKLQIGDRVLIYKGSGRKFHHPDENEEYRIVNISEIPVIL